jgi:predicted RNase H-like nuclease (RuvC/YqgF family)
MSGDIRANDGDKVSNLKQMFEESATHEMRTMQEIDRNISEVGEYIDQMQRFWNKKSSEIKDLRRNISDSKTGRVVSGYSFARDMIQQQEKQLAEKSEDIMRLKKDVEQRDLRLSMAQKNVDEINLRIQKLSTENSEKNNLIEKMNRQIIEIRQDLEKKNRTTENPQELETKCNVDCKHGTTSVLTQADKEKNEEIEKMRHIIAQLEESLTEKEKQQAIERRLGNYMKIRQLESLAKKSVEIEELLDRLKRETANYAAERTCQPESPKSPGSKLPNSPLHDG